MATTKTPISLLQEIFAQQAKTLPIYQELPSDSKDFRFKFSVVIDDITVYGFGHSKKEAKQNCAQEALLQLGVGLAKDFINNNNNNDDVTSNLAKRVAMNKNHNYIGQLHEHASGHQVSYPIYGDKLPQNGLFVVECQFLNMVTEGIGPTKKNAKQEASKNMLEKLGSSYIDYEKYQGASGSDGPLVDIELMKKYDALFPNEETNRSSDPDIITLPKIETCKDDMTLDELIGELEALGHQCKKELFQKDPYIVVLKIDSCVVMGSGKNLEDADNDLFVMCKIMFDEGFSFEPPFKLK